MITWVPKKKINTDRVNELLAISTETNHFTNGSPVVALLEQRTREVCKIDDSKAVVCVSNGTVALWAAVAAIELYHNKDLRMCTQSFTFPASAQGYLDTVKIVDIDQDGGLDLNAVDPQCDGIIVTNIFGNVVDIQKYERWCSEHNKFLLFDNAATANTYYKGKNSSNYGTAATLSFHHTKPIGFGEGGCIIIDSKYERALRSIMNFGIDTTSSSGKWHRKGGNYKMSDLQAAYILQYLDGFDSIVDTTTDLFRYFLQQIATCPRIKLFPNFSDNVPFVSCISILTENSKELLERLLENNIYCRKYYNPLLPTPVATAMYDSILCISCTVDMTRDDIDTIVRVLQ